MANNFKKYKAFTLIELLIVVAIIGIVSAVVLTSYRNSRDQKAVETEARKFAASLREAQNNALTGKNGSSCPTYSAQMFSYGTSANNRFDFYDCNLATYYLSNAVTFDTGGVPNFGHEMGSLGFKIPFGTVIGSDGVAWSTSSGWFSTHNINGALDIILKRNSEYYHVCLYLSGRIEESKGGCT